MITYKKKKAQSHITCTIKKVTHCTFQNSNRKNGKHKLTKIIITTTLI